MKRKVLGLSALAALGLIAGAGTAAAQDCSVKAGVVLPTSIDWGKPLAATTLWVAEMINEAGGVDGCKVETILRDDQGDPKVGVDATKALVELDKVPLILGSVSSGVTMPMLTSVTIPAGVMQVSCCSSSNRITQLAAEGGTKGLWFRTFATSNVQGNVGALLVRDAGYKKVVVFYKNDDWGQDIGRLAADAITRSGVEVVKTIAITDNQPSYRAEVTEALAANPDGLYLALYPKEGISVVREWLSLGGTQKMVSANSLKSDEFRDAVGLRYLADFIGSDTSAPRVPSAGAFVDAYKAEFGAEPTGPGLPNAFDATAIALLAWSAAGKDATGAEIAAKVPLVTDPAGEKLGGTVDDFKKALALLKEGKPVSFQGGTGPVTFDQYGDVSAPAVSWEFTDSGVNETRYIPLEEITTFMGSIK